MSKQQLPPGSCQTLSGQVGHLDAQQLSSPCRTSGYTMVVIKLLTKSRAERKKHCSSSAARILGRPPYQDEAGPEGGDHKRPPRLVVRPQLGSARHVVRRRRRRGDRRPKHLPPLRLRRNRAQLRHVQFDRECNLARASAQLGASWLTVMRRRQIRRAGRSML